MRINNEAEYEAALTKWSELNKAINGDKPYDIRGETNVELQDIWNDLHQYQKMHHPYGMES